jgi:hypothetical protein
MTERILGPTGSAKRRRFLIVPILAVMLVGALWIAGAQAVHDDGLFELDRNAVSVADDGAPFGLNDGEDWDKICPASTPPGDASCVGGSTAIAKFFTPDDNRIFTGGATKDDLDITGWQHTVGSVPDKDELLDGYAARYGSHLYFGADRFAANGSAQMGIWFVQDTVAPITEGSNAGFFTGAHKDGDVLILSDFTKGGEVSTIRVFRWNGPAGSIAGAGAINGTLDLLFGSTEQPQDCVGTPPDIPPVPNGDPACATVNAATAPSPWPFQPKQGGAGAAGSFPAGHFYEGGIDLADPDFDLDELCFSSVIIETRSSPSVDAVLKDFVRGSFEACGANISIGNSAVNKVGDSHTFTVTVTQTISGTTSGVAGIYPTVTLTSANGIAQSDINVTGNTCVDDGAGPNTGTNSSGQCTVVFTSSKAGTITGHASASVSIGGTNFPVETDGSAGNSGDAVKRFVDATISLAPLTDTNGITELHTVTATVQQDDGLASGATGGDSATGFGPPPVGTTVTFSLANNTANAGFHPTSGSNTCTTVANGTCSIQITSSTAGSVDIHASTSVTVGGVAVARATGPGVGTNVGDDAQKTFIDGTLIWEKRDGSVTGALLGGAQFSVCRTHTFDSATSTMVDTADVCLGTGTPAKIADDVSAPGGTGPNADNDAVAGKFKLTQLVLGRYRITETDAPPGYAKDPTPQDVDLTLANPSNADATAGDVVPVFVNEQLFRVIVITCNDSLNPEELVDSTVKIDGTDFQTITAVPAALAAKTVTQADLCAIGGASKGGLAANPNLDIDVELPDKAPLFP